MYLLGERWFEGRISPLKSKGDKKLAVMVPRILQNTKKAVEAVKQKANANKRDKAVVQGAKVLA